MDNKFSRNTISNSIQKEKSKSYRQQLTEHCEIAWQYLKKYRIHKRLKSSLPCCFLLLGSPQAGKTSFLKDNDIALISPHHTELTPLSPTHLVDFWISQTAVFIDPASSISLANDEIGKVYWQTLLDVIGSRFSPRCINILIVIDAPTLLKTGKSAEKIFTSFITQLVSLQNIAKRFTVTFILSKCDQLKGFCDTFSDFDPCERQQLLGISWSGQDFNQSILSLFNQKATSLRNYLDAHLVPRLHRETNFQRKFDIQQFPAMMDQLTASLKKLMTCLPFRSTFLLQGIYFTGRDPHHPKESFFTTDIIKKVIQTSIKMPPRLERRSWQRLIILPLATTLLCSLTFIWHRGYQKIIKLTEEVENTFSYHVMVEKDKPFSWLTPLSQLNQLLQNIHEQKITRYRWFGLTQASDIEHQLINTYELLLNSQFIPYLRLCLLSQIQTSIKEKNFLSLFNALKTYLAITSSQKFYKSNVVNWYQAYWQALSPNNPSLQTQLLSELSYLINKKKRLWQTQSNIVNQARLHLNKLSIYELAFLTLQSQYNPNNVSLFSDERLEGVSLKNAVVPTFFSSENFKDVFSHKIPHCKETLLKNSWILGNKIKGKIKNSDDKELTEKVRMLYLNDYTHLWASSAQHIQLKPANNNSAVLQRINILLNPQSSFNKLLKLIIGNSLLASANNDFTIHQLQTIFIYKQGRSLSIKKALQALKREVIQIEKANDINRTSYLIALSRFQHEGRDDPIGAVFQEADLDPEPIRDWLNTIAASTWNIIMEHAKQYLNQVWQTTVVPGYKNDIENRYPIFKDSHENISLKNFTSFFGANGIVGTFFLNYLHPFVQVSDNGWSWKRVNDIGLNISQTNLNSFSQASLIQEMFFINGHVMPNFEFIISPLHLSAETQGIVINMDGEISTLYKDQNEESAKRFFWPAELPNFLTLKFITVNGRNPTVTYYGPWALFRMLDNAVIKATANPLNFIVTLQLEEYSANLQLLCRYAVNPITADILHQYRCPDNL